MLLGILIPVGLLVFFKKKYRVSVKSFFIGCAVMLLFALILEQIVHAVVLGSQVGSIIRNNIWLYALYGGLMAGIFEESGRFLAMRFLLKKEHDNPHHALMYGVGHGGFEAMVLLTLGMVNNLIYSVMINLGQTQTLLAPLDESTRGTLQAAFDTLITTPSWHFLLSPMERIGAIAAQISLSVIVWFAVSGKKCRMPLFLLAILLHAVLDAVAVIAAGSGIPVVIVELIIWGMAAVYIFIAKKMWKKYIR
ncbi:MAG: YhfC family intramembrane metalloprotease [Oliverpabstia sp.]